VNKIEIKKWSQIVKTLSLNQVKLYINYNSTASQSEDRSNQWLNYNFCLPPGKHSLHSLITVLIHNSGHFRPPLPFWAPGPPPALPALPMASYATASNNEGTQDARTDERTTRKQRFRPRLYRMDRGIDAKTTKKVKLAHTRLPSVGFRS